MVGWHHSMDTSLTKLRDTVEDRAAWHVSVHGVTQNQTWLSDWNLRRDKHWQSLLTHSLHGKHFLLLSEPLLWLTCSCHNSWKANTQDIPPSLSVSPCWRSPSHQQRSHTDLHLHHPQNSLHVGDWTPWYNSTASLFSVGPDCAYVRTKLMDSFSQLSTHSNRRKYVLSGPPSSIFSLLSAAM